MKRATLAVLVALAAGAAHAETYSYSCKNNQTGKRSVLKVDAAGLHWQGKTYQIEDANAAFQEYDPVEHPDNKNAPEPGCAKGGWNALENSKKVFTFCYATKGVGFFANSDGTPAGDFDCDQLNRPKGR